MQEIRFLYDLSIKDLLDERELEPESLAQKVSDEINGLKMKNPLELIFHVIEWEGIDFIVSSGDHDELGRVLYVDLCEFEEIKLSEGPFAGKIMKAPILRNSKKETMH